MTYKFPAGGGGGGAEAFTDLTDASSVDLAALNAPLGETLAGYQVGAVRLDGVNTALECASLTANDADSVSLSFWFLSPVGNNSKVLFATDPLNGYQNAMYLHDENMRLSVGVADGSSWIDVPTIAFPADGLWHHYLSSTFTDAAAGQKKGKVYIDDKDVTAGLNDNNSGAFTSAFNGFPFVVGNDGDDNGPVMDIAEFWLACGQSLLDEDGDIPEATRRKFRSITGRPVNLGITGQVPTGLSATVLLHVAEGAEASSFANNLGTGGEFTVVGPLVKANTSPSASGFPSPMSSPNDMIVGGVAGCPERLPAPASSGTFTLKVTDGTMAWVEDV